MASFVPRTVQRKNVQSSSKSIEKKPKHTGTRTGKSQVVLIDLRGKQEALNSVETVVNNSGLSESKQHEDEDEDVVSYSKHQRWPNDDEPVCVVCGRYGAYICSQTEKDVCSMECKARHLKMCGITLPNTKEQYSTSSTDMQSDTMKTHDKDAYLYNVHHTIMNLTPRQVEQLQQRLAIQAQGSDVARPILEFFHCQFNERLSQNISICGYHTPTPVQMQVIPVALSGRDVVACAQTGSGKTAAFLLPMIARIHHITGTIILERFSKHNAT